MRIKTVALETRASVVILLVLALVPVIPVRAQQKNEIFTFTKIDMDLLEQCSLLDKKFDKEGLVYTDDALNSYLDQVANSILPAAQPEHVQWRFRVLRDPQTDAFALPNGSIYLNSGILSLMDNESQLASVMAHEMAHVLNRHTYAHNRSVRKKAVAINILGAAAGVAPIGAVGSAIVVIAQSLQFMLVIKAIGYSRELEKEADLYAANRLLDSPYEPEEMVSMFKLLNRDYDLEMSGPSFYSDHPKLTERIAYVGQLIQSRPHSPLTPELMSAGRSRFLTNTQKIARHDVQLDLEARRFRTALAVSQKLVEFDPNSSENLFCLAEAYRSLGPRTMEPTGQEATAKGREQMMKLKRKLTPDEEEKNLMSTPIGQSAWKTNQLNAEEQYKKALEIDGNNANAHRGFAMLLEQEGKTQQAIEHYRKYLELRPNAMDRLVIQRRVDSLEAPKTPLKTAS